MKTLNILTCGIFLMSLLALLTSCGKDDMPNTKYLQAYLAPEQFQTDASLPMLSFELFADGTVKGGNESASVTFQNPVKLSKISTEDITVNLKFGEKLLVDEFNKANNTAYRALPDGAVKLSQASITVKAGKLISDDKELTLRIASPGLLSIDTKEYLVPIVLQGLDSRDAGAKISSTAMYIKVKPTGYTVALKIPNSKANLLNMTYLISGAGGIYVPPADGVFSIDLSPAAGLSIASEIVSGDVTMVAAYNTANKTNYSLLPATNYTISNDGKVTFAPGQSTANLSVTLRNGQQLDPQKQYLLPLTIKKGIIAFSNQAANIIMVLVSAKITNIDPANTGLTGIIINRAGWSVSAGGGFNPVARVLDGNNATAWVSSLPAWMVLDMASPKVVKGFSIVPNYEYSTIFDFIEMEVLSSNDGITWKTEGQYKGIETVESSTTASPDIKNVKFIAPVNARYFKFNITKSTGGSFTGLAELNAIQ